jgi:alpha-mannosidase
MIGNAHIDPVWLWAWQEGFQEVKASFRSALDRMKEFDFFVFTCSSAAMYEWVERNEPVIFEEIRQRVAEGRWVIVGGWWIQPDCNIPGGESFVRQGLLGQRYFMEKFGKTASVGYNVDSFGHAGMLPQILRKSGLDAYVFMRPMPHEKSLPAPLFWWESDDGSRVMSFRIIHKYESWGKELEQGVARTAEQLIEPLSDLMMFYGVGNHGGGPTIANIESIVEMNERTDLPELAFSSPDRFFETIRERGDVLPVVHDDLQHHAVGCYAAHSGIKMWNRRAENRLSAAELFAVVAEKETGLPYPDDYRRAWKNVLFNQFHDILAGTSIREAYDDARDEFGEALAIAGRGLNGALQSLSWNIGIDKEEGMKPVVVFNGHSWSGTMPVKLELGAMGSKPLVLDESGRIIEVQVGQASSTTADPNGRFSYAFVDDLPAMGYRVYRVYADPANAKPTAAARPGGMLLAEPHALENGKFRLAFDPDTGWISSLYDKKLQSELFAGAAARPAVLEDFSDTWSHGVFRYDKEVGQFKAADIRVLEAGPVKATIRVVSMYGQSKLVQDFSMYRDLDQIEVKVKVDWRERFKMLKLMFPVALAGVKPTYETPYGHIVRESNGDEEPMHSWVDYSGYLLKDGPAYGISLMNDGKHSCSMNNETIGLTVLRSPIYAHHVPAQPDPEQEYEFMDQGIQRFTYALLPHPGSWERAGTVQRALELNQPPLTVVESYHDGRLPQRNSFIDVDQSTIVVCALKKAEDGGGYILRCRETIKKSTVALIKLPHWGREIRSSFGPCEIKTFYIPADGDRPVVETDLIERPLGG